MSANVKFGCMDLARQGHPLFLGEGSGCAQSDVQSIQRSLAHDNGSFLQKLQAPLVQPAFAKIPSMHAIAQSHVVNVEGKNDDNNEGDSSGSLQFFGSQLPACFVEQLVVAHIPLPGPHGSCCPSLKFVAPDGCCAPMLGHIQGRRPWGGGNNAVDPVCGEFDGSLSEDLLAIKIPSKKLVYVNQTVLATCAETCVVGHVLQNYTCLSFGIDLYDADFGDLYDHQTVLVGDYESSCDIE